MSTLQLTIDDELLNLLAQADETAERGAVNMIVLELFRRGTISTGKAAELLAIPKPAFIDLASSVGIEVLDLSESEWHDEARAAHRL
jgi:predicted HTH domain antitoxin